MVHAFRNYLNFMPVLLYYKQTFAMLASIV